MVTRKVGHFWKADPGHFSKAPKFIASSNPGDSPSQLFDAQYAALLTIADRIFIRTDIRPLKVDEIYINANKAFSEDRDDEKFGAQMDKLINAIVEIAEKL
ncbi:MAG: hypothetical protein ACYCSP_02235 [Acidobacteriaceae bacterium]